MMTKSGLFARTAMALALPCASGGAYAQSAGTSDPAESPEVDADPQEIVVTAQRREQTLIEVPQSISVIGGETLERQQARSFLDYAQLVPGFTVNTGAVGSTVSTYLDDTPFGASGSLSNGGVLDGVVSAGGFPFSFPAALGGNATRLINVSTIRPRTIGLIVGAGF